MLWVREWGLGAVGALRKRMLHSACAALALRTWKETKVWARVVDEVKVSEW